MPKQLTENQQKWIDALRSGKYKQGKMVLETADGGFCCLGVACKEFIPETRVVTEENAWEDDERNEEDAIYYGEDGDAKHELAPDAVIKKLNLRTEEGRLTNWPSNLPKVKRVDGSIDCESLADLNDAGWSFLQIADFIESYPQLVFTNIEE